MSGFKNIRPWIETVGHPVRRPDLILTRDLGVDREGREARLTDHIGRVGLTVRLGDQDHINRTGQVLREKNMNYR